MIDAAVAVEDGGATIAAAVASRRLDRPRLIEALGRGHRLTALIAPTGWGKTTLLEAWAAACGAPLIRLDAAHADAWRLQHDLDAALAAGVPALAIDDLQVLSPAGLDVIRSLLRVEGVPLVVAGRAEPAIGLSRLRLDDDVLELRARELAFTADELAQLLEARGLTLTEAQRARLLRRTEGWAAGLSLALCSLRGTGDVEGFLAAFGGNDRAVADYLMDEVLSGLDAELQEFVLRTCVVDDVCGDLAAVLTGRDDSGELLERLARDGVPIAPAGPARRWYRWHPLFAELLRTRLAMRYGRLTPGLHVLAADWLAGHGRVADALAHVAAAGPAADAVELLERLWLDVLADGGVPCERALAGEGDARLRVVAAGEHLRRGDAPAAERALAAVDDAPPAVTAFAALLGARAAGDVEAARRAGARVLDTGSSDLLHALAQFHVGLAELSCGSVAEAGERLLGAAVLARGHDRDALLLACAARQAALAIVHGDGAAAGAAAADAVDLAARPERRDAGSLAWARAVQAALALWDGDALEAERLVALAAALAAEARDGVAVDAVRGLRAHVCAAGGDLAAARSLTRVARDARHGADGLLARWLDALGPTPWAPDPAGGGAFDVARALSELRSGDPRTALQRIAPVAAEPAGHPSVRVHALVIEALARDALGVTGATEACRRALGLADRTGYRVPFAFPEPGVAELRAQLGRIALVDPADAVAPVARVDLPGEPLTERELGVLRLLATLLTPVEMAGELLISLNTVKTHIRAVYRKLGVHCRRDAVRCARELGVL
ncbi:MAG TPA: LuxR C-terminal-related transcriptional regulator [Solirubrobacter sp.]|nr:LuxR C-terminal-related transcriptional regulator [Solirubrobacter sp.]